jgi:hypothetical protein
MDSIFRVSVSTTLIVITQRTKVLTIQNLSPRYISNLRYTFEFTVLLGLRVNVISNSEFNYSIDRIL